MDLGKLKFDISLKKFYFISSPFYSAANVLSLLGLIGCTDRVAVASGRRFLLCLITNLLFLFFHLIVYHLYRAVMLYQTQFLMVSIPI